MYGQLGTQRSRGLDFLSDFAYFSDYAFQGRWTFHKQNKMDTHKQNKTKQNGLSTNKISNNEGFSFPG